MDISSEVFDEGSSQSNPTGVPPRAEEIDRTLRHLGLKNFATAIEKAAAAVFPNDKKSRYSQVFVLLISWETRDPNLPVEQEISALRQVLEDCYHYDIEEFQIPDIDSHAEVSEKVNSFVKSAFTNPPTRKDSKYPIVMWSGIQRSLEMANSDVLILLDGCSSGVANASEGNGVTELIYKAMLFCFGLYTSIYTRMQLFLPQGIENERYPAPVHFVLTNDEPFIRGIKLSVQVSRAPENEGQHGKRPWDSESSDSPNKRSRLNDVQGHSQEGDTCQASEGNHAAEPADHDHRGLVPIDSMYPLKAPWVLFAIRFREDIKGEDLSIEHFKEWLRSIPATVDEVRVEANFKCSSKLLLVNMPEYIDWDRVAHDPILSQEVLNGHSARMRYSRFKKLMDGSPYAPYLRTKKKKVRT
ncbi:hypothetical protein DL95DRAFT_475264 [Leptodontidium sp. 2 PMI_412]|nr:hypothetical protein DL95DRAFT_475264 [Leptodontidium sp. 2 PMI_412]